jgi:hypothetical protein
MRTTPRPAQGVGPTPALVGLLAALVALAPPCARAAAGEGAPLQATGTSVELEAGRDYALVGISDQLDTLDLLDPGGRAVATVATDGDLNEGREFRARYTARYFVRDRVPGAGAWWEVAPDCRGDARTRCRVKVDHPQTGHLPWANDQDWRAIKLLAGRTYTAFPAGSPNSCARFVSATGRNLSGDACEPDGISYRASKAGVAYLVVYDSSLDEAVDYSVVVRVR